MTATKAKLLLQNWQKQNNSREWTIHSGCTEAHSIYFTARNIAAEGNYATKYTNL
jgi:hypothetical protein